MHGMEDLRRSLARIADRRGLRDEIAAAAEELRDADDTLSHSLTVVPADDGTSATISTPLDGAWHREFGSLHRPPRPWLAPALDKARPRILARLRAWLSRAASA
jgi:hypothetical protein